MRRWLVLLWPSVQCLVWLVAIPFDALMAVEFALGRSPSPHPGFDVSVSLLICVLAAQQFCISGLVLVSRYRRIRAARGLGWA